MGAEIIVETDVAVPMRDGTVLRADVYRPAEGPAPTLLERTPYSKDQLVGTIFVMNPMRAARAGYSVVVQDVRGRFSSDGDFYPFVNESLDGYDTVEWCAAQPWSTGKVGMFGSSYMAAAQWQAAKANPPHLTTITPFQASADYRDGRSYRGGAFELGSLLSIALYALGAGQMARLPLAERRPMWDTLRGAIDDISATSRAVLENRLAGTVIPEIIPYFFDWLDHNEPGPYWDRIDVTQHYQNIDLPVLHVSCWFDQFLVGTIRNFVGMRERAASQHARDNQHLFIGPWGHYAPRTALLGTARIGDMDLGVSAVSDLDAMLISWFDRWMKDEPIAGRAIAPVRLFVTGSNTWHNLSQWPPETTATLDLFMHSEGSANSSDGDGRLDSTPPTADEAADTYLHDPADPVPTCGGAHLVLEATYPQGAVDQRDVEARDDVLVFTTHALDADVEVLGPVTAHLTVESTAPSADFDVTVSDVHPDGRSLKICDGILRTILDDGPAAIVVDLGVIGHRFLAGHRIRVHVASSNFPRYDLNPAAVTATQSLHHSAAHTSLLRLPISAL
ncbi:MAG TPA: CocE/NonD family hydrolase [Ilumatobacteraceae bacterium]|nr:CocE/NonD family hydrolase [Ilumatobacteraceae bacterium]